MTGFCEHGNENPVSKRCGELFDKLNVCHLVSEDRSGMETFITKI
jgi:hypothetical protein